MVYSLWFEVLLIDQVFKLQQHISLRIINLRIIWLSKARSNHKQQTINYKLIKFAEWIISKACWIC